MSNLPYSLAATIYFTVLAVSLLVFGTHAVRSVVMMSLFLGAVSQFVIQGRGDLVELHSNMFAYVAMALLLIAMVLYIIP